MPALDPSSLISRATLVFNELSTSPHWQASLDAASVLPAVMAVRNIAPPHPTTRATLPDYAVITIARDGAVTARFALHLERGRFLEAEGVKRRGEHLKPYANVQQIALASAGGAPIAGEWVWGPCRQSTSRFAPFFRFQAGGTTRYVRADGAIYETLNTTGQG